MNHFDVIIIGAGAAGLMCGIEAGNRGRSVLLIDHAKKIGEKIRISGGGRCNFTNIHTSPANFISHNPHFCKSAISRYTQWDFVDLIQKHQIAYHEKTLGQLFCDDSAQQIIDMLLRELTNVGGRIRNPLICEKVQKTADGYEISTPEGSFSCTSLVVATGGKSIPKIGASGFGYKIAEQFNLPIIEPRPALVPLTFDEQTKEQMGELAGLSVPARVSNDAMSFEEGLLFTHKGLSGPSILQISSYWKEGETISLNMLPHHNVEEWLVEVRQQFGKSQLKTVLGQILPNRLAEKFCAMIVIEGRMADLSKSQLDAIVKKLNGWQFKPVGSEGYRTAEVTLGGVATDALSSKTMEVKSHPGLYFIGEVVDVTGHLGGFNFQWAWSSGWVAGQAV